VSYGKGKIEKLAAFDWLPDDDFFAFNFGDVLEDGSFDVYTNSNNGDMLKVLTTIIDIIKEFANEHPLKRIFFTGSTSKRTALYHRILKSDYIDFNNGFIIIALIRERNSIKEVAFDPTSQREHLGFFIRKK
jgi:hypothetical protein